MKSSLSLMSLAAAAANAATIDIVNAGYINYTTVTGYFQQDDPSTNPSTFNYVWTSLIKPTPNVNADPC